MILTRHSLRPNQPTLLGRVYRFNTTGHARATQGEVYFNLAFENGVYMELKKWELKKIADDMLYTKHAVEIGTISGEDRKQYNQGIMDLADKLAKYCEEDR
jgi:hypothetical protein